jgi:CDP-glucose 4,6-dehydratase
LEDLAVTAAAGDTFWRDKRVLVTGHSGFKGSWLTLWLHRLGATVTGVSLPPATTPNLYSEADIGALCDSRFCDIRDVSALGKLIEAVQPEIVFHLAAQALVRASYQDPLTTLATNVMGTANVLEALRGVEGVRAAVMVTTDKVYHIDATSRPFREDDKLGGVDPYSASKAACEIVVASYRDAFLSGRGLAVASARAGNVIGGGDWSDDRLIPDAIRAWQAGTPLEVRRPMAVRPWQHVLEPLAGYLTLARSLWLRPALAGAYNLGPNAATDVPVRDVVELARIAYGSGEVNYGNGSDGPHESAWLGLDASKATAVLGVTPRLTLKQAVNWTIAWYRAQRQAADSRQLCLSNIRDFEMLAPTRKLASAL